ncbi:MAG: hypothetical protein PHI31_09975 [Desulfuromonadaceae bacterium]|nr:hypothetical protein [Desulfuromonadaceae bacterium]
MAFKTHFPTHRGSGINAILFADPCPDVFGRVKLILNNHFVLK